MQTLFRVVIYFHIYCLFVPHIVNQSGEEAIAEMEQRGILNVDFRNDMSHFKK